jgi:hypothetical protein
MAKAYAQVVYTHAILKCPHCGGNLAESWSRTVGLVCEYGSNFEKEVPLSQTSGKCGHCYRVYHYPDKVR